MTKYHANGTRIFLLFLFGIAYASLEDILSQADDFLVQGDTHNAIDLYQQGIDASVEDDDYSLTVLLSLYTNLGTAISSIGDDEQAVEHYKAAIEVYRTEIGSIVEKSAKAEATDIVVSAAFYLGMAYQDLGRAKDAVGAYDVAVQWDPLHWAAAANKGSVQQDVLKDYRNALVSYNQAYRILAGDEMPTDPPEEPNRALSQLQYRIGLCISYDTNQKCVVEDTPNETKDCRELATHAFALAVQYDPNNEFAKHMLASMTADVSMTRASNEYVKALFDEYAGNFEHSLVKELQYTGFERLRRGFDRAMSNETILFETVLDAGCGTGLVGEQFRNISKTLIGVDLSQAILDQAVLQRPGLYDEMIAGDVIEAFRDKAPLSLIIAADSYIYFGNLDPLFFSMSEGLEVGGLAAFTLENVNLDDEKILEASKGDWRWQLTASGRFAHRKEYVEEVARRHSFTTQHYEPLNGKLYI